MNVSLVVSDIIYLFNINYFSIYLTKISTKYISGMIDWIIHYKQKLDNYFSDSIFKIYKVLIMSDNLVSRRILEDMDRRLEGRKPIEAIRDDINELKVELIHIKNYLRKLEIREQIKEDQEKETEAEYVKPEKGWFW
jgi:hypothetical protein